MKGERASITIPDLVDRLRRGGQRLPFEIGAFVALETAERLVERPVFLAPGDVRINEDGHLELTPADETPVAPREAARGLLDVLTQLLLAAGSGVPPVLLSLVDDAADGGGSTDLATLRDELEASLVPLNRGAARRVLARIVREHGVGVRGRGAAPPAKQPAPRAAPSVAPAEADRALDALFDDEELDAPGGDEPPPRPWIPSAKRTLVGPGPGTESPGGSAPGTTAAGAPRPPPASPRPGPAGIAPPPTRARPPSSRPPPGPANPAGRAGSDPPPREPQSYRPPAPGGGPLPGEDFDDGPRRAPPGGGRAFSRSPLGDDPSIADRPPTGDDGALGRFSTAPPGRRMGWIWAAVFVALALGLVALVAVVRPDVFARLRGEPTAAELEAAEAARAREAEQEKLLAEHRARYGDLVVTVSPPRAQVLLLVGRGPATAESLPVGVAYEFVAIAEGHAPARAVVPADAEWDPGADGAAPTYELAMQAGARTEEDGDDGDGATAELALGPSQLPRDVGRPTSTLGRIRVVTNPRGAKVYLLIGFAPEVRVRDLPAGEAQEVLVYREGFEPRRVVVEPDRFEDDGSGERVARIRVELTERAAE